MTDIREYLAHKPLLFDGGMGTYYKAAPGVECELANLTDPEGVKRVHAEYLAAGAQAGLGRTGRGGLEAGLRRRRRERCRRLCGPRPGSGHGGRPGQQCLRPCSPAVRGAGGKEFSF